MKQQEILKKIGDIIKDLNEQYEFLQSQEGMFNELELELFSANAHFLVDHTKILKRLNVGVEPALVANKEETVQQPAPEPFQAPAEPEVQESEPEAESVEPFSAPLPFIMEPAVTFDPEPVPELTINEQPPAEDPISAAPEPLEKPVLAEVIAPQEVSTPEEVPVTSASPAPQEAVMPEETPAPEIAVAQNQPDTFSYIRQTPEVSSAEHTFSISSHSEDAYEEPAALTAPEPASATASESTTSGEEAEQPVLTLNQKLSAQLRPSVSKPESQSTSAQPAISDIKSAINLNDKMLFVKDLFNGYSLSYSEAVDLVNRCKSFDDADRFLKTNYAVKNHWADKPATTDKFYAILRRRFPQ
ncbi:hypothetical protein HH214_04500 [Mucilaginibacter robiniae]|uniref:Uncharacterized protein n=1 Tax=Mucilaginibacter robiniae TaxID=2728022 RepID=A0A7L5DYQ9_9SPHI|nr:hypothetical protein [Mucilaginibacter robiniae]QJD95189.1 hypothetical protein HH214_04500 [Mucilaginibacter robiniae]